MLHLLRFWGPIIVNGTVPWRDDPWATARRARAPCRCIRRLSRSAPSASRRLGGPWPRRMARRGSVTQRSTRVRRRLEGTPPTVRGDDTALYTPWRDSLRSSTPDSDTAARAAARRRVAVRSKRPLGTAVARQDRGRNTHWRVTWGRYPRGRPPRGGLGRSRGTLGQTSSRHQYSSGSRSRDPSGATASPSADASRRDRHYTGGDGRR